MIEEVTPPLAAGVKPGVTVNWPPVLDGWFRGLLRQEATAAPEVGAAAWDEWLQALRWHGLSALVYSWLQSGPAVARPPAVILARLQDEYILRMAQAGYRRNQLRQLLLVLQEAGVKPIVLKGAALAETEYAQPELRPSVDIDVLVLPDDYARAREVMCWNGYRGQRGEQPRPMEWNCSEELIPTNGKHYLSVELHWSLSPYAQVIREGDVQPLFERAKMAAGRADSFLILDAADELVHLCQHQLYKHPHLIRLIWLHDIHLLATRLQSIEEWQEIVRLSLQWQARLAVEQALSLAAEWFGTPVPAVAYDLEQWPPLPAEAAVYEYALYRSSKSRRKAWLRKHLFQLTHLDGRGRLAYLANRFFPSRAEIDAWYPALRNWPYPLAFFGRLVLAFSRKW